MGVDDSTGLVTLASGDFDEGDEILCSYRYDVAPYVAQEIRIEPSREIQGIDGLGSEEIQLWALLQKEFTGSIREVFRQQAQLERLSVFSLGTVARYFSSEAEEEEWEYVTGSNTLNIANGVLSIATGDVKTVYSFKPLPEIGDFKASVKIRFSTSNLGIPGFGFRYTDLNHYYFLTINGTFSATKLTMNLYKRDGGDNLLSSIYIPNVRDNQYYKLTVEAVDDKIRCKIDLGSKGVHVLSADDSSFDKGKIVLDARKKTIYYDDLRVTDKNRLDGYGIIVSWDDGAGHIRKIGFDNVTFPSGSLPTPKNEPVFVETPFKAESGVVIS